MDEAPFNPLEKAHLAESVAAALETQPEQPLPPAEPFTGAGIYAIYYRGSFGVYSAIADGQTPLYVGSALPEGGQTGGLGLTTPTTRKLYQRLAQHSRSIEASENLDLTDFSCRYLLVDDVWIPLAENYMISKYRPVWNSSVLRGFGIHAPGKGRAGQKRSLWDELHPGRTYASGRPSADQSAEMIIENVAKFLSGEVTAEPLPPESATDVIGENES